MAKVVSIVMPNVTVVVLYGVVEADEGIESSVRWCIAPVAEAEVPFAGHVGAVAQLLQMLGQSGQVGRQVRLLCGTQTLSTWPEIQLKPLAFTPAVSA